MKSSYSTLGIMAGSSMDGLDIVHVDFHKLDSKWNFSIGKGETIQYESDLFAKLKESAQMDSNSQELLDIEFGNWIGDHAMKFIVKHNIIIDLIAVHGHTVIHQPHNNLSWQLGSGLEISKETRITTISDFRSLDISIGGQGAPLVPMGDFHLFDEYDACLNLGGIANVSLKKSQTAWDITPCNQLLNFYANQLGKEFDKNGELSRQGSLNTDFMKEIGSESFFKMLPPKSLPNKFINEDALSKISPKDGLRTMTEFIARQIASDLRDSITKQPKILISGGGAHNDFLIERIKYHLSNWEVIIPSKLIIDFKEALVFAFLGVLRLRDEENVLASVTGASKDSSSGVIHFSK